MNVKFPGLAILFIVFFNSASAQQLRLNTFVKPAVATDSFVNATIRLYSLPDSILLYTQVSSPKGNSFTITASSRYLIKLTAIGYESQSKMIVVADKPISITILLKKAIVSLKEVVVTSKKPLITQEDDKTIVDPTALVNTSTNAYEVLEKTPGAIVDQDGNIYLNSSTPASVYINGREMRMSAEDIASLLKSLPAGSISRIEILRTPSAKYDAANSGGIVNVILKKGVKIGTTGSVTLRGDQGVYSTGTGGFSLNVSKGKLSTFFSYQFTKRITFDEVESKRLIANDTLLLQQSYTKYKPTTNYLGGGLDYELSKKLTLSYDLRLSLNDNHTSAISTNKFIKLNAAPYFSKSETPITNNGNSIFFGNTLSAKYKIDSIGSDWVNEISYNYSKNNNKQLYTNNYALPVLPAEDGDGNTHNIASSINIKSDLTWKLKKQFVLESGLKWNRSTNDNEAVFYIQKAGGPIQVNNYQTNTFHYIETISSAYLQLSKKIWGITFKAGLRLENTNIIGHQKVPADTSFSISRTDLFPYIYIKRNLFKIFGYPLTGNAIYRKSISRPGYDALNPSPKFVDQFLFDVGNTRLQPQFTTNYELNISFNETPVLAIGVNDTKNIFSRVTYQDDVTKIAYRTFDNLGKNKEIYFRIIGATPNQSGRFFVYAGAQYNYQKYDGYYQGGPLQYKRGSWRFFTGQQFKVNSTTRLNAQAWLYVNGFQAFNELKNMGQLNISVTKTFFNNKLNIILSGNDVLLTNKVSFKIQQGTVSGSGKRLQDTRRIGLTLRYNFGIKPKEEKKQNDEQQPEGKEN